MSNNATTPEEVVRSYRQPKTLTVFYQEGPNTEINYASIPVSTKYKEVLDSACECFEEFLPPNWETHILDLQHEISEGRWAVIHPSLFEEAAEGTRPQFGEIKLRVRPPRIQRPNRSENNGGVASPTSPTASTSGASFAAGPPSYDTAVAHPTTVQASGPLRLTLILENPEPPISAPRHDAWCDRCSQMIFGIRYKCATCEDFDYCSVCIAFAALEHGHRFDAIINGNTRLLRSIDAWRVTGREQTTAVSGTSGTLAFKHDARCDICGMNPIKGTRFKCAECPDWDTCQGCLERSFMVHPEHTFIRVTEPPVLMPRNTKPVVRAPVGIRCSSCQNQVVGPVFYQCKTTGCRVSLCADCEALPITQARPCQHALMKYRWPWATQG